MENTMNTVQLAVFSSVVTGLLYVAMGLSGCGVSYGQLTLGTTGYLAEANRGRKLEAISQKDRQQLSKLINKGE